MAAKFGKNSRITAAQKTCLYSASVREREEEGERDGVRVDAGGARRGRQVGAVGFLLHLARFARALARGLAQVRKADGWFLQM